jgi:dTDP-4-amino-4,6-dideoxygalactose transaminase
MLTTSNPECHHKFRLCRQHGTSIPDTVRHGSQQVIFEDYLVVGFNYQMTDIQAAVGRASRSSGWPSLRPAVGRTSVLSIRD